MTRHPDIRVLAVLLVAAGVAAAIAVTLPDRRAPARSGDPAAPAGTALRSVPAPGHEVDLGDPAAVCEAFAAALFTIDSATDADPAAAHRRAAAYATSRLAAALILAPARRLPAWQELTAHRGRTDAEVGDYAGEPPPARTGTAHYAAVVTTTPTGTDGWTGRPRRHIVCCTLTRSGPQWQVAEYDLEWHQLP
jgi:hypothetical protein